MTSQPSIDERVRTALATHLKRRVETIDARQSLRDDLGLDSMATIELLFRIEETFDLQIPDQDLQRLSTVGDVISYIEERVASPPVRTAKAPGRRPPAKKPASTKKSR
jgi:acyl carrier protein